ncbi:MAG: YhbY family RNA-binding protein [Janthinobacterium lividum]
MPALNVSPTQRATLRAQAHPLKPVIMIGSDGLTEPVFAEAERALGSHELIKIRIFDDDRAARSAIGVALCERLNAGLIQQIGKLLVIWRPAPGPTAAERAAGRPRTASASPQARRASAAASGITPRVTRLGVGRTTSQSTSNAAPRLVKIVKPSDKPGQRSKPKTVLVRGNERVTAGGTVKRAKKRQTGGKRTFQQDK